MKKPFILLALGVLLFIVSLAADTVGIGEGTGIGWKQISGAVIGGVIAAIGIYRLRGPGGE
jgi:high-affinity Fe2+/Pb2+ permease